MNELIWKSAEHWLQNWEDPKSAKIYTRDCPLCQMFLVPSTCNNNSECPDCPIPQLTGFDLCRYTPWEHVSGSQLYGWDSSPNAFENYRNAIAVEYRFLVCLALGDEDEAKELCKRYGG